MVKNINKGSFIRVYKFTMAVFERKTNAWRRRDTFPNINAAGKLLPQGDRAQDCLQEISPRPETPPVVRKFIHSTYPEPGTVRECYRKTGDPNIASALVHGVRAQPSINDGPLINPPPKTLFQNKLQERQEAIYSRRQKALCPELPIGLDPSKTTFAANAGESLNPRKPPAQVEEEAQEGHKEYLHSHNSYLASERVNRKYDLKSYNKDKRFGVHTPHRSDGHNTKKSVQWIDDAQKNPSAQFVSKRCDDFRQRTQPQIGKVRHPIADISRLPADHTFGSLPCPEFYGAGDIIYPTPPSEHRKGLERQDTLVSVIRQQLKKANYQNFNSLLQAFRHYDKKGQGRIDKEDLRDMCREFKLDLSTDVMDELIEYCDVDKDGLINFLEFANFLNWKDKMPISQEEQIILTREQKSSTDPAVSSRAETPEPDTETQTGPKILAKCEDLEPVNMGSDLKTPKTLCRTRVEPERFITSSSTICSTVGALATDDYRTYGVPSVRTDLAVPCIKRISDRTNYGEEGTAYELLFPSLNSLYGVDDQHFLCSRTKIEMEQIFRNAGLHIPEPAFEEAWSLASRSHPSGEVCVASLRNFLSELQTN